MNRELLERPFAPEQIKQREGSFGDVIDYLRARPSSSGSMKSLRPSGILKSSTTTFTTTKSWCWGNSPHTG